MPDIDTLKLVTMKQHVWNEFMPTSLQQPAMADVYLDTLKLHKSRTHRYCSTIQMLLGGRSVIEVCLNESN
jgi:hypothetical protein